MCQHDDDPETIATTSGRAIPYTELKVVDDEGRALPAGEPGEVLVRGYNVMKGYYNNEEATRAAIDADGWLHTGDEASQDPDGYFRITGRIKDLIIRGGENIAPKEIEDRLRQHAMVADAYVYGVPDSFFGETVAAAVRLRDGAVVTGDDMIAWCASALARFKVPKYVRFVSEFPMTASGKIQKYKLRQEHEQLLKTSRV
jgi:fatty-acyl-CoA synthase